MIVAPATAPTPRWWSKLPGSPPAALVAPPCR